MDQFEQYELEFSHKIAALKQRINQFDSLQGERRKNAIREAEMQIENLKDTLSKMEQLAKNASRERARKLQQKLRGFSNDLTRLQRELQHNQLVSPLSPTYQSSYSLGDNRDDHRQQILSGTSRLEETSERLQNTHRIAVETEHIGTSVLGELVGQRRQLENARDNLGVIDDNMTRSRKILSSMARRVATNKVILAVIILVLLLSNGLIIYFKWIAPNV